MDGSKYEGVSRTAYDRGEEVWLKDYPEVRGDYESQRRVRVPKADILRLADQIREEDGRAGGGGA